VIIGSFIGLLVGAHLADRIGRRANFLLFAVCSLITVVVYTQLPIDDDLMLLLGFPLGFFATGIFAGMGAFLTENFPKRIRASGQGFACNFGRGIAALNPTFVGLLSATLPLGQSIGVFAASAYALLIIAALLLTETRGRELTTG
jgi:MFS family permease